MALSDGEVTLDGIGVNLLQESTLAFPAVFLSLPRLAVKWSGDREREGVFSCRRVLIRESSRALMDSFGILYRLGD